MTWRSIVRPSASRARIGSYFRFRTLLVWVDRRERVLGLIVYLAPISIFVRYLVRPLPAGESLALTAYQSVRGTGTTKTEYPSVKDINLSVR
jgi:hypothetical protein